MVAPTFYMGHAQRSEHRILVVVMRGMVQARETGHGVERFSHEEQSQVEGVAEAQQAKDQ